MTARSITFWKLANVPGQPYAWTVLRVFLSIVLNSFFPAFFSEAINEVLDKQRNVWCAIAQRRHLIGTTFSLYNRSCRNLPQPRACSNQMGAASTLRQRELAVTADAFDLTFLQATRNSAIWISGASRLLRPGKSSAVRRFKTPRAPLRRTVKAPFS